ncbi:MAG: tetratricopeptide repeat protein [Chloracidobacterium sp.]|nr:tetratricopeptide repeat protein [Chloracidobacterium sp.]
MVSALSPETVLQNRYRIISRLDTKPDGKAKGGMGAVYLAVDTRLSCEVAVKQTINENAELSEEMTKAFEREAKLLAILRHPSLPRVTNHFIEDNAQFLVMDLVHGNDLDDVRRDYGGWLPVELALNLADQLLAVLEYLHSHNPPVIHRDIKPSNLKLTQNGHLMLLDFGLAKGTVGLMSQHNDRSLFAMTEAYASPEQLEGEITEARSDLFSVGATFYELLTGQAPLHALTKRAFALAMRKPDPLCPIHELNMDVPVEISRIFMQALALDIENRPSSASEFRRVLGQTEIENELQTVQGDEDRTFPLFSRSESEDRLVTDTEKDLIKGIEQLRLRAERAEELVQEQRQRQEAEKRHQAESARKQREAEVARQKEIKRLKIEEAKLQEEKKRLERAIILEEAKEKKVTTWKRVGVAVLTITILGGLFWLASGLFSSVSNTASDYYGIAYNCEKEMDNDCALANFSKAIELRPDFPEAYLGRGTAYVNKGSYDDAITDYSRAIELRNAFATAYHNRGVAYARKGNFDNAIRDYNQAIELEPNDASTYHNRGLANAKKGNYEQAIKDYNRAINIKPNDAGVHVSRGVAFSKKGNIDQAIADYRMALKLDPTDKDAKNNLEVALKEQKLK